MSKYYSIHEFSKIIGVSAQTLRNWDANGKLHPHHTTVSGYRYYSDEQLSQVINVKPKNRITIGYCRVSSHKQKDDLERQIDNVKTYLLAKGQPFEIISDIGSGIDYKKKGLQELIRRISQNQVEKVVVLYKDRLLRFGFVIISVRRLRAFPSAVSLPATGLNSPRPAAVRRLGFIPQTFCNA